MKKIIPFLTLLLCAIGSAQNINEALRYSSENLQGTARFQSMGGAFGALGGDLSSLNINPAGSAVFSNSLITFSGSLLIIPVMRQPILATGRKLQKTMLILIKLAVPLYSTIPRIMLIGKNSLWPLIMTL